MHRDHKNPVPRTLRTLLAAAAVLLGCLLAAPRAMAATVEYENLRQLLLDGNPSLQESSYFTSLENIEYQLNILERERDDMRDYKKEYQASDPATAAQYERSADSLTASMVRLRKQLDRLTNERTSSLTDTLDSLEMTAQTRMNAYNQMAAQAGAKEKTLAAAQRSYESTLLRYNAGMATEADILSAGDKLLQEQNALESYRQQVTSLRRTLLSMLGLPDTADVTIGASPAPDLAAIAALDFEGDKNRAVNNDPTVQMIRHTRGGSTLDRQMNDLEEQEAVGNAEASFTNTRNVLQARLTEYSAAQAGLANAQQSYDGTLRRRPAGMATETDVLKSESQYLSAQAQFTSASISVLQAWEDYKWEVKGVGGNSGQAGGMR